MSLSDVAVRSAKPREKIYKLSDSGGLYLEIRPTGGKWWRWKYRYASKEKRISLGVYPETSLRVAREKRDESRRLLASGIDPSQLRKAQRFSAGSANSFETLAREWHSNFRSRWDPDHGARILRRLESNVFPWLGRRQISDIKAQELLTVLRRIQDRGAIESAHRILQYCGQVFRYSIVTGRAERDVSSDLKGALPRARDKHLATIVEPRKIGELLRLIDQYEGQFVTKCALKLTPLLFVRAGELRKAKWDEFDLEQAEWRIPAERMKMKEKHIVPLSRQALSILRELEPFTNRSMPQQPSVCPFVFPGLVSRQRPMSENAVLYALRRIGYTKEQMTGHGFRSMASTLLHELGWNHQAIERQLAHSEPNAVSAAYNFAEHMPERRKMMQAWADYLDELKETLS
jgi:integrase